MHILGNIHLKSKERGLFYAISRDSIDFIKAPSEIIINSEQSHGEKMIELINNNLKADSDYFLNFEEDHFCVLQDKNTFDYIMQKAAEHSVDVIRTSFHQVEMECSKHVPAIYEDEFVKIIRFTAPNFEKFCIPFKRFYLGTNCIFKAEYAKKFFRRIGHRPHDYELRHYQSDMEYTCLIPKVEILRPIDDDHGAENTCCLKNPTPLFTQLYNKYKN
jgi:hypothetical protein